MACLASMAAPAPVAIPGRRPAARAGSVSGGLLVRRAEQRRPLRVLAQQATKVATPPPAITLSDNALSHLTKLRNESGGQKLLLRMGVKSGGCSGMSYLMDFEKEENVRPDDAVMEYEGGFKLVCDPKSLLYLFGMRLDYSDALIGGGFQFLNPNAESSCGCGKSFGV